MPFNVTMPDGTLVQNVPDGTTKSQLMSRYQKTAIPVQEPQKQAQQIQSAPNNIQPNQQVTPAQTNAPVNAPTNTQQDPSLAQRITGDIKNRFQTGVDIMNKRGEQNPLSTGLQMAGKVVYGTAGDIAGEVGKSAYNIAPDIGQWKEKVQGGIDKLKASPIGQVAIQAAQKGGLEYVNWAKQHPEAAANVESLVDIASFIPKGEAAGAAGKVAGEVTGVGPVVKGLTSPNEDKMKSIVDTMHKNATNTIERAKNSGISYSPEHAENIMTDIGNISQLKTAGERASEGKTVALIDDMKNSILGPAMKDARGKIIKDASGEPMRDSTQADTSLRNLFGFSKRLGELGGQESSALSAKKIIDKAIGDTSKVVTGDSKDVGLVNQFKKEWGRYKTGEDVADAAKLADTSSAKSRKAFLKIKDSDYFTSLSPEVQKLVTIASKGKMSGKFLDAVGSVKKLLGANMSTGLPLLEAGGAVMAGHPAAALAVGGIMGASEAGKQIQRGTAADVLSALQQNK